MIVDCERKSPAFGVHPVPREGTSAVDTDVGAGRDGRRLRADEPRGRRTAKSCGPDARIAGVKSAELSAGDGGKKLRFTRESTYKS